MSNDKSINGNTLDHSFDCSCEECQKIEYNELRLNFLEESLEREITGKEADEIYNDTFPSNELRPLGDITGDLEPLILEMTEQHQMQWGEILSIVFGYLRIHCPDSQEIYEDDTSPEYYYGPEER